MFEKYGEFDSYEEINQKAKELLKAGETDAVRELAKENGLDPQDAEDYITGAETMFCTALMAAVGKLNLEEQDLKLAGNLKDWKNLAVEICTENSHVCACVRKKGKSLKNCLGEIIKYSFEHKVRVDDRIVDTVKIKNNGKMEPMRKPLYLGGENRATVKILISGYYMK